MGGAKAQRLKGTQGHRVCVGVGGELLYDDTAAGRGKPFPAGERKPRLCYPCFREHPRPRVKSLCPSRWKLKVLQMHGALVGWLMLCLTAENSNLCPFIFSNVENNPKAGV